MFNIPTANSLFRKGKAEREAGQVLMAVETVQKGLDLEPESAEGLLLLARIYADLHKHEWVIESCTRLLRVHPDSIDGHLVIGTAYLAVRDYPAAVTHLGIAARHLPNDLQVVNNLALALISNDEAKRAIPILKKCSAARRSGIHANFALAYLALRDHESALAHCRMGNAIALEEKAAEPMPSKLRLRRLIHDREQMIYLRTRGLIDEQFDQQIDRLEKLIESAERGGNFDKDALVPLTYADWSILSPVLRENFYIGDGEAVEGGALNQDIDAEEIQRLFHSSNPEYIYVDNLLNEKALEKIYRYCLESTIFRVEYGGSKGGYFGSTLIDGLASRLVFQISSELQGRFPKIFKNHPLKQSWVFKQDHAMPGLNIHADFAAVNVNFWITPDEANLDPEHGGLLIWDVPAPANWNFDEYQNNEPRMYQFLEDSNASQVRIPYKQNRAVIFNSSIFHASDNAKFKEGYENRRLNLTFLYGEGLRH